MPEKETNRQFTNYHRPMGVPCALYVNLEANLEGVLKINRNNPDESYMDQYQDHIACSYVY